MRIIFDMLCQAADLEGEVKALDDSTLRQLRGWLAQGEAYGWVAERVHGVCILEGCARFCAQGSEVGK